MYSYSKMDTDTEPKPKSTYNREKYEQNKEKIVTEFGVFTVIILVRRVCNRVGGDLIYISFINHYYIITHYILYLLFLGLIIDALLDRVKKC
jgi:hypothetical protein